MSRRTIGYHTNYGLSDSAAICDICGSRWPRSQLWVDGEGMLVCPDEGDGRDRSTLSMDQARSAQHQHVTPRVLPQGNFDKGDS